MDQSEEMRDDECLSGSASPLFSPSEGNDSSKHSLPIWSSPSLELVDDLSSTQDVDSTPCSSPTEISSDGSKEKRISVVWNHCKKRKVEEDLVGESKQQVSMDCYHFDPNLVRRKLANMVILHEYPLNMVEHIGFREFSASLQPLFKMVCRNTLKRDIFKIYDYERGKTFMELEKIPSRIAISTSMWTSSNKRRQFMLVKAHYIDDSWTLESRFMRFIYVPSPHTNEVLSNALLDCLLEWNVDRKLSTVVVDDYGTTDAMIKILLDKFQISSLILHGSLLHMRCAAYIFNLIAQDGLAVIGESIDKIRESVLFWTTSKKRNKKFEEAARQLYISSTKELILDSKTHWNSTYLMLSTALVYKDVFLHLRQCDSSYNFIPSEIDWEVVKDVCGTLELFYDMTKFVSGTTYPKASMYFHYMCQVKIELSECIVSSNEVIRKMASNMLEKFDSYWNVVDRIMGVAAVLDPRFKMKLLEWCFPTIYGDTAYEEIEKIRRIFYDLLEQYHSKEMDKEDSFANSSFCMTKGSQSKSLYEFDLFVSSELKCRNVKLEFDHYIEDGVLPRTPNFDILSWWKGNGVKYPTLQRIARDILAVPVSTVALESPFSTNERLLGPHRNRLHPKTLEALMCAQNWLQNEIKGSSSKLEGGTIQTILDDYDDLGVESDDTEPLEWNSFSCL